MIATARKPVDLHALLALGDGPLHGYGLTGRIEEQSEGRLRLLPGNLYAVLSRLADRGLIRECDAPHSAEREDSRRKYFELTELGKQALEGELHRLERLVISARARGLLTVEADEAGR